MCPQEIVVLVKHLFAHLMVYEHENEVPEEEEEEQ